MSDKPVAYFDMDGTLCDYTKALQESLNALRGPSEPAVREWDWDKELPEFLVARMKLIKAQGEWWENLPRFQLGWDVLEIAKQLDFRIVVLTQGPRTNPVAWSHKVKWCMNHLPDVDVCITRDKGLNYGRVLVDDYPEYALRWLEHRPRGLVIMPAQPYNKDFEHSRVIRYNGENEDDVAEALLKARQRQDGESFEV